MRQPGNKVLIIIIAVLLLINIGMILFIWKSDKTISFHNDIKAAMPEFLQKEIGFSSGQMTQYDSLSCVYNDKFKASMDDLRKSRQEEFKQLAGAGFNDSAINSIAIQSAENKKTLEIQLLQYTKDIRKICTPDQQVKFDSLLYKVLNKKN
jgi:protein CpxP